MDYREASIKKTSNGQRYEGPSEEKQPRQREMHTLQVYQSKLEKMDDESITMPMN